MVGSYKLELILTTIYKAFPNHPQSSYNTSLSPSYIYAASLKTV